MNNGFITLHRKIIDWEWYDDINTTRLFIHCLLRCNHKDNKWRGKLIKRGTFLTSLNTLSKETKLTTSQIRTSIKKLKSTKEIAIESQAQSSVITMLKYDLYQTNSTVDSKTIANQSQTNDKPMTTNNNENNENNETYKSNIHQLSVDRKGGDVDLFNDIRVETKKKKQDETPYEFIVNEYKRILFNLPQIALLTPKRKAAIKKIYDYHSVHRDTSWWTDYFTSVARDDFLMGRTPKNESHSNWVCTFDYLMNLDKAINILEKHYK